MEKYREGKEGGGAILCVRAHTYTYTAKGGGGHNVHPPAYTETHNFKTFPHCVKTNPHLTWRFAGCGVGYGPAQSFHWCGTLFGVN